MHPADVELLNATFNRGAGLLAEQLGALAASIGQLRGQLREEAVDDLVEVGVAMECELTRRSAVACRLFCELMRPAAPGLGREELTDAQQVGMRLLARRAWELADMLLDAEDGVAAEPPPREKGEADEQA